MWGCREGAAVFILLKIRKQGLVVSSEGALIAITPYDYPRSAARPLFEHTPVLDNNLNINAMMTLVTMITIKTEITKTKSAASVA